MLADPAFHSNLIHEYRWDELVNRRTLWARCSFWYRRRRILLPDKRSIWTVASLQRNRRTQSIKRESASWPAHLIDLSMPVHNEMVTFPRVVRPALVMFETWQGFAERIGAAKYGVDSLTAHYMVVIGDHIGTAWIRCVTCAKTPRGPRLFRSNIAMGRAYAWTSVIFQKARVSVSKT